MTALATAKDIAIHPSTDSLGTVPPSIVFSVPRYFHALLSKFSLRDYRLTRPLIIHVREMEPGQWLVTSPFISTHGTGEAVEQAIHDFESMLIDLFQELDASEHELAPHLLRELHTLRRIIHKVTE